MILGGLFYETSRINQPHADWVREPSPNYPYPTCWRPNDPR
jgi:hypothetical protein